MSRWQRRRILQALAGTMLAAGIGVGLRLGPMPAAGVARSSFGTTVAVGGDITFDRYTRAPLAKWGPEFPLAQVAPVLRRADIAMANLETPLTTAWDPADKRIQFHSDPVLAVTLREAGLDVVNVANNHAMDQNQTGLNQTISVLRAAGLQAVGAGFDRSSAQQAAYRPTPSGLVAILGFTDILPVGAEAHRWRDGVTPVEADVIWHDIRQARERAGWVMVNVHWGVEYSTEPSDRQRQVAHWLIDAGADVVFGGHPHVVQGVEIYRNRPIVYSLGNFVFDQPWAITQETAVAVFGFNRGNDWQLVLQPAAIHNSQPDLIHDGFEWREFIARETRLSQKLGSRPGLTAEGELLWSSSPAEP